MPASALHSRARGWAMLALLLPDSESQQSQEGGEPTHNHPPPPCALNKTLSIRFVQEAGGVTKTNQTHTFALRSLQKQPSSFRMVSKLLPVGSISRYHTCSL